jgi:hypothetical protein
LQFRYLRKQPEDLIVGLGIDREIHSKVLVECDKM